MYVLYGIPNCDTVKKARNWLEANKIVYEFHDYKKLGITQTKLKEWSAALGWELLVNTKGTTWRKLDPAMQQKINSAKTAIPWLAENTSAIKRPLIEKNGKVIALGFDPETYPKIFKVAW
ncbi:MAG: ArsC family reductase [Bacteroidota bacterium]|nr:ArsC family reductase [Bacteroidota bacterium]